MKKQLILIINGKGGVGKSMLATNLVQYFKDRNIQHLAIDTDNENSTLKRFHKEADYIDIDDVQEIDNLFTSLERSGLVLVDCRAASTDIFLEYFNEIKAFEILATLGAVLTVIIPVNHEADSVEQVRVISESLTDQCRYLIAKNQSHSEQFRIYERSRMREHVMTELGGAEITIPRLYDWLVTSLNESSLTVTDAIQSVDVSLIDRQRLKNWQARFNEQIDLVGGLLLPTESPKEEGRSRKAKSSSTKGENKG